MADLDITAARAIIAAAKVDREFDIASDDTGSTIRRGSVTYARFHYLADGLDEERATFFVEAAKGWASALDEVERLRAELGSLRRARDNACKLAEQCRDAFDDLACSACRACVEMPSYADIDALRKVGR